MKVCHATLVSLLLCTSNLWGDDLKRTGVINAEPQPTACHGTAIQFVSSPVEAARRATQEKKLVFVLHVSGYFEDPEFT
jgi:hypothetical protein